MQRIFSACARRRLYGDPIAWLQAKAISDSKTKPRVPILKFPHIPLKLIMQLMHPKEIFRLSMCSHRVKYYLENINKLEVETLHFSLRPNEANVIVNKDKERMHEFELRDNENRWYEGEEVDMMYCTSEEFHEYSLEFFKRLLRLFKTSEYNVRLKLGCLGFMKICDDNKKEELKPEMLDYVFDNFSKTKDLNIEAKIPTTYKHENAFKIPEIFLYDGRWVKINNLLSLRSSKSFTLWATELDCKDVNTFLKHWIHCDYDTVRHFRLGLKRGCELRHKEILDGIEHLEMGRPSAFPFGKFSCALIPENIGKVINLLGYLIVTNEGIWFNTHSETDYTRNIIEIMKINRQKVKLTVELGEYGIQTEALLLRRNEVDQGTLKWEDLNDELQKVLNQTTIINKQILEITKEMKKLGYDGTLSEREHLRLARMGLSKYW